MTPNAACRQGHASTSGRVDLVRAPICTPRRGRSFNVVRSDARGEVTLLDYGAGNVRSVRNAIKKLGYNLKEVRSWPGRRCKCTYLSFYATLLMICDAWASLGSHASSNNVLPTRSPLRLTSSAQNGSSSLEWEPLSRPWESSPGRTLLSP